ncbi:alpha-glucan family phosphorylase, partial [Patescibacteria group bacterium]|nr:alpha-glucan family phosphorylase [Patescibacteria group bacterium]
GFKYLYYGDKDSDHRLYQNVAFGFGSNKAAKLLGIDFPVIHLNESPTAFFALAELDHLCQNGLSLEEAMKDLKGRTVLTNHTLSSAAEGDFTLDQFNRYVMPNLESDEVKNWLSNLIADQGCRLQLRDLTILLSGDKNGVSRLHSKRASDVIRDCYGNKLEFTSVTNGIFFDKWVNSRLLNFYKQSGIIDDFDLPAHDFEAVIDNMDAGILRGIKDRAREELKIYLKTREDQYGHEINIPESAKVACWAKRFDGYKRPEMLFENPELLAKILEEGNIHVLLAGKAHPTNHGIKESIKKIFKIIDNNTVLRERVHFVQNYNEELGKHLVSGVDIWFNTPIVGEEACGTSWEKAVANLAILISTIDGGVADVSSPSCLPIKGSDYWKEVDSMYTNFLKAARIIDNMDEWEPDVPDEWGKIVKDQLRCFLPILSGARMVKDDLTFFPPLNF